MFRSLHFSDCALSYLSNTTCHQLRQHRTLRQLAENIGGDIGLQYRDKGVSGGCGSGRYRRSGPGPPFHNTVTQCHAPLTPRVSPVGNSEILDEKSDLSETLTRRFLLLFFVWKIEMTLSWCIPMHVLKNSTTTRHNVFTSQPIIGDTAPIKLLLEHMPPCPR